MNESREQLLFSRIADGDANDQEWNELESLAQVDPRMWRQLAEVQRDHISLMRALGDATTNADAPMLPALDHVPAVSHQEWQPQLRRVGTWSGWAVAALVAIMAGLQTYQPHGMQVGPRPVPDTAGLSLASVQDAFQSYLDKGKESGQVVGEMPTKVLLESRPDSSGQGFEVIYLRQVMERIVVPDLYQINGENELGQPMLARYTQPVRNSM